MKFWQKQSFSLNWFTDTNNREYNARITDYGRKKRWWTGSSTLFELLLAKTLIQIKLRWQDWLIAVLIWLLEMEFVVKGFWNTTGNFTILRQRNFRISWSWLHVELGQNLWGI